MQLHPDARERAFAEEVRSWLADNLPAQPLDPVDTPEGQQQHREWERLLHGAGYAGLSWPVEFGGAGLEPAMEAIFNEEYLGAGAPERLNRLALGLAGPSIIAFGTDEQKARWLPRILRCEDVWCQGFSEPEAGSDLASVRTRAVRDGAEYVIDGQKIWTTFGAWADWMFALVRTGDSAAGHKALTFLMIPMHTPGVQVRPLRQLHGADGFAEVFFTGVRVPVSNVLGEEGGGWQVAMATLGFERSGGVAQPMRFDRDVAGLIDLVHGCGLADDPVVRDAVASRYAEALVFRRFFQHMITRLNSGQPTGPIASLGKLFWSEMEVRIYETALDVLGERAQVSAAPGIPAVGRHVHAKYWYARASGIYAGTTEIQKNIISERLLGLPKEPRCS
ncbi:MAG TPA: acyl-CoA dehydrogenase family protein [Mycobacterium sp.]|nr:acyl-CoA dehydrogenase family protein [Mycobacterium sp.]